ncbi:zinc fingers and homeoboxes protein 1-like [Festucalex cinctus]
MASRRKSSTPCMLPPHSDVDVDADADRSEDDSFSEPSSGGYECKSCSFRTKRLQLLTAHVDSEHPDAGTSTSYHTGSSDTVVPHNWRHHPDQDESTGAEARLGERTDPRHERAEDERRREDGACRKGIALSKTPIMRSRAEPKKFGAASHKMAAEEALKVESEDETDEYEEAAAVAPPPLPVPAPLQIPTGPQPALLLNGANVLHVKGGGGVGALPAETLAQVLAALQKQNQNQLLIPVSSIPAYNAAMDNNVLLLGAYARFPYPSPAEIAALASQTQFSEENVKVWFSAQRLKHGISWTPDEVQEARKRKSNGSVQTLPQTIAVIPANMAANGLQSIFQTCQIVGQPGLVLAQVGGGPAAAPVALAVSGARTSEPRPEKASSSGAALDSASKPKKSKEQLAELKASYGRRQFATDAEISRLMQVTGLSKRAIKKWFSDTRYNQRNSRDLHHDGGQVGGNDGKEDDDDGGKDANSASAIVIDSSDDAGDSSPTAGRGWRRSKTRHAFPDFTPQKFKEKTSGQLLILESSFRKCDTPSDEELTRLRAQTKLTRREVDAWFSERRKGGGAPKAGSGGEAAAAGAGRRILKKTPAQLDILKKAFVRSRWPTAQEYDKMARDCGLPRNYVVNWFGDTRYAAKNSSLKWFDLYHAGKADEASPDAAARTPKKSRKRFRGWSRRTRRPYAGKQDAPAHAPAEAKSGKAFLRAYFLQQPVVSEEHLDELAAKSDMSAQQIREWFSRAGCRLAEGKEPFSDHDEQEAQAASEDQQKQDTIQEASPGAHQPDRQT